MWDLRLKEFFNTKPASLQQIHSLDSGVSVSEIISESRESDCGTSTEDINSSELYRTGFEVNPLLISFQNRNASLDTYCRLVESDCCIYIKI